MEEDQNIQLYEDVTDIYYQQHGSSIHLTWTKPNNSIKISVTRKHADDEVKLSEDADAGIEDHGLIQGNTYTYVITTHYPRWKTSQGVDYTVTVQHIIPPFTIHVEHVDGYKYRVSWQIDTPGIDMRILATGVLVSEVKSDQCAVLITLEPNDIHEVSAEVYSNKKWVPSVNTELVDTHLAIAVDDEATAKKITESQVSGRTRINVPIVMENTIGDDIAEFKYAVRTIPGNANRNELKSITIKRYNEKKYIPAEIYVKPTDDDLYITVVTVFIINGNEILSKPLTTHIHRPKLVNVFYDIKRPNWLTKRFGLGDTWLRIEAKSKVAISKQPRMILCACDKQDNLRSYDDERAELMLDIEPEDFGEPTTEYEREYALNENIDENKNIYLFIDNSNIPGEPKFIPRPKKLS